ncbi:MAG TPA: hypothetical protein VGR47_04870 [Terracidiphilus sp.]|nr:hypothetical protein [Terracidiphilus sp.]
MHDTVARASLLSHVEQILASQRVSADLREAVIRTHLAIIKAQELIDRNDRLLRSISKVFGGSPTG